MRINLYLLAFSTLGFRQAIHHASMNNLEVMQADSLKHFSQMIENLETMQLEMGEGITMDLLFSPHAEDTPFKKMPGPGYVSRLVRASP